MNIPYASVAVPLALVLAACSSDTTSPGVFEGGPPVCEGGPRVPTVRVTPEVATTGLSPNVIRELGDGTFAITESASNTVSRWNGTSLELLTDVEGSRNPYDIVRVGDEVWITNYLSETISVADLETGESVELGHSSLEDPTGIGTFGGAVVVSNVAFTSPTEPYGPGSFTVFDGSSREVLASFEAAAKNPMFVESFGDGEVEFLVTTSSGELFLNSDGAGVGSPGAVEVWQGDPANPERTVFPVPQVSDVQIGAPGRPLMAPNGVLYFASGTAPVLFALDPESGWLHGSDDPLVFGEPAGDALHHADMTDRGVILITSFNRDGLVLWDTTCDRRMNDEPIDLGLSSLLEGPHGILVTEDGPQRTTAYFITSISNALGRIELSWE